MRFLIPFLTALALFACSPAAVPHPKEEDGESDLSAVPHFAWVSKDIARGGQPVGDEAFRELAAAGIRTIVNVDGAQPDVETAKKYGLRYVHIPFGYEGVPEEQRLELAKTVRELPGPFFFHCHHGKHRGPVGAVLGQMALGGMTNEEAVAELGRAGTAEKYKGLWACAREATPPSAGATAELEFDFPEVAPVEEMVDAMARADRTWDNLRLCRAADWAVPADHPDLDPPHEALQLLECFVEIGRTDEAAEHGEDFGRLLTDATEGSRTLEAELRKETLDGDAAEAAFRRVSQSCSACHTEYRNNR